MSSNPVGFILEPFPFAQLIIDIEHPGPVEDVGRWLEIVPVLDFPILVSRQLTTPHTPGILFGVI